MSRFKHSIAIVNGATSRIGHATARLPAGEPR